MVGAGGGLGEGHPRVGGGTANAVGSKEFDQGPSPRGRGNPPNPSGMSISLRAIPAWAGEPPWPPPPPAAIRGHPRVGGGTADCYKIEFDDGGPSPRGRGNLGGQDLDHQPGRAIPAWAGEPSVRIAHDPERTDHPRVGGGTTSVLLAGTRARGPSPRGRGNPSRMTPADCSAEGHPRVGGGTGEGERYAPTPGGPSPRGRGNPIRRHKRSCRDRAIPAWAGEPLRRGADARHYGGHPRVGGGTCTTRSRLARLFGPSPRGRGNQDVRASRRRKPGAIPAWAGEPMRSLPKARASGGHPRVGGGTDGGTAFPVTPAGPSPRGRGNLRRVAAGLWATRAIPAWAGEPPVRAPYRTLLEGHPRVGGGTGIGLAATVARVGPSPRGRGNRRHCPTHTAPGRAIPAWAGEPKTVSFDAIRS